MHSGAKFADGCKILNSFSNVREEMWTHSESRKNLQRLLSVAGIGKWIRDEVTRELLIA